MSELLPCPGCGQDFTRVIGGPGTKGGPQFWAGCDVCRWRTWGNTERAAIDAWNTRALSAHGLPVVDEERFTMREIVQALTHHYKFLTGDDRHVPATITAVETMQAMRKFIHEQRDAALSGDAK